MAHGFKLRPLPQMPPTPEVLAYIRAMQMGAKTYHLLYKNKEWILRKSLSGQTIKTFPTKTPAQIFIKNLAKKHKTEAIIHGMDGRIKSRHPYWEQL